MSTGLFILLAIAVLVAVFFGVKYYIYKLTSEYEERLDKLERNTLKYKITVDNKISVSAGNHKDIINYKIDKK